MIRKIVTAIALWAIALGALFVLPVPQKHPELSTDFENFYASVCEIHTGTGTGSGVLLESGYVLTVAHNIDRNNNGELDDDEKTIGATFHSINFKTKLEVLAISNHVEDDIDIALCRPVDPVPLFGARLCSDEDYWSDVKIGTQIHSIGMTNGESPANVTDGRIITRYRTSEMHRNSASSYFGNSGGGIFTSDGLLVGISTRVGVGQVQIRTPVINPETRRLIGYVESTARMPIAGSSLHVSAPAIHAFLIDEGYRDALATYPRCPMSTKVKYYALWSGHVGAGILLLCSFVILFRKKRVPRIT